MIKRLSYVVLCMLLFAACQRKEAVRYQLEGGDPTVDFFYLQGDTLCTFYGPGHVLLNCPCRIDGNGVLTVQVTNMISTSLMPAGKRKYAGEPPFFEGVWARN